MAKLTDQQMSFFSDMENTFQGAGWGRLTAGWKEEQGMLAEATFFNAKSMEDVNAARVRYGLLTELLQLSDQIQAQREQIESDDEDNV